MHSPISILRDKYRLPLSEALFTRTDGTTERNVSENQVIQLVGEYEYTPEQYLELIGELLGYTTEQTVSAWADLNMPKYVFRYLVLGVVLDYKRMESKNIDNIYLNAITKAQNYLATRPEIVYCTDADESAPPKVDSQGNVVAKKGDKKVIALEWWVKNKDRILGLPETDRRKTAITELKEFGWSDGTASTYYQNLKSGTWA